MINRKKVLPIPLERITSKENHNVTLPTLSFPSSPNQMNDIVSALKNFTEKFTNIFQPSNEASNPRHTSKIE
jgi:hypothetical protein